MKSAERDTVPKAPKGSGIVCVNADRRGPDLRIDKAALDDSAVRGIIDDWLAPMIVGQLIRDRSLGPQENEE